MDLLPLRTLSVAFVMMLVCAFVSIGKQQNTEIVGATATEVSPLAIHEPSIYDAFESGKYANLVSFVCESSESPPVAHLHYPVYTRPVVVWGNNPDWTKIAYVPAHTIFRVYADGAVKFGPLSTTDTAIAGVEGNRLFKWIQQGCDQRISKISKSPRPVYFNQGGVWIYIVNHRTGQTARTPDLYYYWAKTLNIVDKRFDIGIDIHAKAHDGGRDPGSRRDYNDNTGYYRVWIELESPAPPPQRARGGVGNG